MEDDKDKRHGEGTGRGRSNHAGESIGKFDADTMAACIVEINFWENKPTGPVSLETLTYLLG